MKVILEKIWGIVKFILGNKDKVDRVLDTVSKVEMVKDTVDKVKSAANKVTDSIDSAEKKVSDIGTTAKEKAVKAEEVVDKVEAVTEKLVGKNVEAFDKARDLINKATETTDGVTSKITEKSLEDAAKKAEQKTLVFGTARFDIEVDGDENIDFGVTVGHSIVEEDGKIFTRIGKVEKTVRTKRVHRVTSNVVDSLDPVIVSVRSWLESNGFKPKAIYNVSMPQYKWYQREEVLKQL